MGIGAAEGLLESLEENEVTEVTEVTEEMKAEEVKAEAVEETTLVPPVV